VAAAAAARGDVDGERPAVGFLTEICSMPIP